MIEEPSTAHDYLLSPLLISEDDAFPPFPDSPLIGLQAFLFPLPGAGLLAFLLGPFLTPFIYNALFLRWPFRSMLEVFWMLSQNGDPSPSFLKRYPRAPRPCLLPSALPRPSCGTLQTRIFLGTRPHLPQRVGSSSFDRLCPPPLPEVFFFLSTWAPSAAPAGPRAW